MMKFNKEYWENRYENNETGWAIGKISTPIKEYIDQISNKNLKILIPGAGNGFEFDYLIEKGFKNVYVVDIASQPLKEIALRHPNYQSHLIENDFFELDDKFDLILEQTFFCALDPELRNQYATKMYNLLNTNGKIAGLLFNFPLTNEGPPFGGSEEEYSTTFKSQFKIKTLENCYNSIKPRENRELFFIFEAK